MSEAEKIVAALAEVEAEALLLEGNNGHEWCVFCMADHAVLPEQHDPDCPWRMAREYVEQP